MREALIEKLNELGREANSLVGVREQLYNQMQEIEVRLHQISGAISEIDKFLKEGDKNAAGKNDRREVPGSDSDPDEAAATTEDSVQA